MLRRGEEFIGGTGTEMLPYVFPRIPSFALVTALHFVLSSLVSFSLTACRTLLTL